MMTKEEIEVRIKNSQEKLRARREKAAAFKKKVAEGNQFLRRNDTMIYTIGLFVNRPIIVAMAKIDDQVWWGWSCRSSKDPWSSRIAKGIAGWRLIHDTFILEQFDNEAIALTQIIATLALLGNDGKDEGFPERLIPDLNNLYIHNWQLEGPDSNE